MAANGMMQHPNQHWTQSASPPGSDTRGLSGPPPHPQYGHPGGPPPHPPPPPPRQQGWGHHPHAPPPPHPSLQVGGSAIIGAPPSGIFREYSGSGKPTDGGAGPSTNGYTLPHGSEGHPPSHGYSHGPPQVYNYPAHPSHGGQQPPPGYYGSQHPPPHHVITSQEGPPPPNHNQWGHHSTYGGAPPPGHSSHPGSSHNPHSSNGNSAWEHQQHNSQSRQLENPHYSEGYFSSHPPTSSGFLRHGLPPTGGGPPPPHSNGGPASYKSPPQSQHPHGSQTGEFTNTRKRPPPNSSSTPGMPPTHHGSSIPRHHPSGPPPPMNSQPPPPPTGYPSNHYRGPPLTRNLQNPSIHPSYSTTSTRTSISATTPIAGPSSTTTLHNPSLLSYNTPGALATSTTYTDDERGRGSYKCGRCGVPKKGHVCPYQPKVKRRPEDQMPEMKCVSTQVEMDEFMTLRRLNIEIQGYPESYAAEPLDMVGTEVGQYHPPPPLSQVGTPGYPGQPVMSTHGVIIGSPHPTHLMPSVISSGDPGVGEPLEPGPPLPSPSPKHKVSSPCLQEGSIPPPMSSSHDAGPQTCLPSSSSILYEPNSLPCPSHEASSQSSSQMPSPNTESAPELLAPSVHVPFPNDTTSLEVCEAPVLSASSKTVITNTEDVSASAPDHSDEVKLESTTSAINGEAFESVGITTGDADDELRLIEVERHTEETRTGDFDPITSNDPSSEDCDQQDLIKEGETADICAIKSSLSPTEKFITNPSYFGKGGA